MGIAQTAIAWAIPKWRSQRFNWGFPELNSMLKLRDQGHLLLEDVDSFTSANDTMLDEEQDTIEECCFHPDLQIPKVCYQINKTQVSHSWCLFKPKNRHGVTLIGILRGREGQHVSRDLQITSIYISGYQISSKMFGCFYNRNGFPSNNYVCGHHFLQLSTAYNFIA